MHGTGFFGTMSTLLTGGCVVTVDNASLDADAIWAAVEKNRVTNMAIVGDPFGKPLLRALDENPGKYDLSCVVAIGSSGAMWTAEVKHGLLDHLPQAMLTDAFASTEALGMGVSVTQKGVETKTACFVIGPNAIVIDDNDQPIEPGSGKSGRLAVGGVLPIGYYKDEEKTARTFRMMNGKRFSIPGDYAIVEADGRITLLGRGSNCINTAGEKVFPEEVEETLKTYPGVEDALVLGVPDEKWGQAITGVVKLRARRQVRRSRDARACARGARRLQGAQAHPHRRREPARAQRQGGLQVGKRLRQAGAGDRVEAASSASFEGIRAYPSRLRSRNILGRLRLSNRRQVVRITRARRNFPEISFVRIEAALEP